MNKDQVSILQKFEIVFQDGPSKRQVYAIEKIRTTIGSSDVCDIKIQKTDISAIHAVIEAQKGKLVLFDMSSTNGTYVNNEKIVAKEIREGETFYLSNYEFKILKLNEEDLIPPVLNSLPKFKSEIKKSTSFKNKNTTTPHVPPRKNDELPRIIFPLSSDPLADKTEYIFEDAELLLPIFKYDINKASVEIVIIYNDLVYSVDYLPDTQGIYQIAGIKNKKSNIEFPYFGQNEKLTFIEIKGEIFVHPLPSFERQVLGDKLEANSSAHSPILLNQNDIVRFYHNHLQIFVRKTDSPPKVDAAPLFNKNNDLNKYLILMMLFAIAVTVTFNLVKIEKPIEKEQSPERIASIIYKKYEKIQPTEIEKPPEKKVENKKLEVEKTQNVAPVEKIADKIPEKTTGSKTAPKVKITKKATPPPAPKDNLKTDVVRPKPSSHIATKGRQGGTSSKAPSKIPTKSKGNVETFNINSLQGSLSSLLAKGGGTKTAVNTGSGGGSGSGTRGEVDGVKGSLYDTGGPGASLQRSKVTGQVGSLTGSAQGSMDISKGAEGISDKRSIYTAGLPYRTVILGGLDPDIIRKILIEHLEQFRFCYQKQLDADNKSFSGVVKMNFIIGASGNVTRAAVEMADENIPVDIRACTANVLKGIQFPSPRGGGVVEVDQPFNFYPKNI